MQFQAERGRIGFLVRLGSKELIEAARNGGEQECRRVALDANRVRNSTGQHGYAPACRRCSMVPLTCAASAFCTIPGGRLSWSCPWSWASGVFPARCRWAAPGSPARGQMVPGHLCSRAFVRLTLLRSLDDELVCLTVGKSETLRVSEFNTWLGLHAPFEDSRPSETILASRALDSPCALQNLPDATASTGERERIL